MTRKYAAWLLLHTPHSIAQLAEAMGISRDHAGNVIRSLVDRGQAAPVVAAHRYRKAVYLATEKAPLLDGRGKSAGSAIGRPLGTVAAAATRRGEPRYDRITGPKNGEGKILLEEVWRPCS